MWEVNDGYQHIILYDKSDGVCFFEETIEISTKSPTSHSIDKTFDLQEIGYYDGLRIRYSASGKFSDTWKNKNMSVEITCE